MILSGNEIKKRIGSDIIITPFNEANINPNSYDVTLHNELMVYDGFRSLDMKEKNEPQSCEIIGKYGYTLYPGKLYLARTEEYTETHNLVPMIVGRSSIGRLGINIHATAGFGDIGFCGFWTLEISCTVPVRIYPDIRIGQIYYMTVCGDYEEYNGKYQHNSQTQASRLYTELQ